MRTTILNFKPQISNFNSQPPKSIFFILLLCVFFSLPFGEGWGGAVFAQTPETETSAASSFPSGEQFKGANITYNIIPAANNTWCYDIFMEGRLFIHQPSAPGMPGNEGFKTKEQAVKVAELVIGKMKKGEMPPSITVEEMKKIGAL